MKKQIYFLLTALACCISNAAVVEIAVKEKGQACFDVESQAYGSSEFLYTVADDSKFIFLEFDMSSLQDVNVQKAIFSFKWSATFEANPPAYISINKGKFSGSLSGDAALDANKGLLSCGDSLAKPKSGEQDGIYSLDISSYVIANYAQEPYLVIAVDSLYAAAYIDGASSYNLENPPKITITYLDNSVPEPAAYAAVFGIFACAFVALKRNRH